MSVVDINLRPFFFVLFRHYESGSIIPNQREIGTKLQLLISNSMSTNNAEDLDDMSFNMESVDEMVGGIVKGKELMSENVDKVVKSSYAIDSKKKKEFDEEREKVLSSIPPDVYKRFGAIRFASFSKFSGPVLILSPYSVAPGVLRDNWFDMFHNCKESGREMTYLVYWYGYSNVLQSAYSFQKLSTIMTYEDGSKKLEKKILNLRQKLSGGKKLSSKETLLLNGMNEMKIDQKKNPEDRSGYVACGFLENYHLSIEEQEQMEQLKEKKSKKGKGGKSKKKSSKGGGNISQTHDGTITTTQPETETLTDSKNKSKTKKIDKKRSKKDKKSIDSARPKKKIKTSKQSAKPAVEVTTPNLNCNDTRVTECGKEIVSSEQKTTTVESFKPSAYDEYAGLGDVSSHGETDDENVVVDDLDSDNGLADEDDIEHNKTKASKKRKKKQEQIVPTSKKGLKRKTAAKSTLKIEMTSTEEKKLLNKKRLDSRLKKEQEIFQSCEENFLDLVRRWESATTNKDVNKLLQIYGELLENIERFSAPFIEEYSMSDLMKQSKKIIDKEKWKRVMAKFKQVHTAKKDAVPTGFKAVKTSIMIVSHHGAISGVAVEQSKSNTGNTMEFQVGSGNDDVKLENNLNVQDKASETASKPVKESRSNVIERKSKFQSKPGSTVQKTNISSTVDNNKKLRFSLTRLMRPACSSNSEVSKAGHLSSLGGVNSVTLAQPSKHSQMAPSWTLQAMSSETPSNKNRLFGLEFLQQAATCIPESENVNHATLAHNLELAIYKWSIRHAGVKNNCTHENEEWWVDGYWNKIHDIVAGIGGKRSKGTLAIMIASGKFATPEKLIDLSDNDLWLSFQSSPALEFGCI